MYDRSKKRALILLLNTLNWHIYFIARTDLNEIFYRSLSMQFNLRNVDMTYFVRICTNFSFNALLSILIYWSKICFKLRDIRLMR